MSTTVSELSWRRLKALADARGENMSQALDELIALGASHPRLARILGGVVQDGIEPSVRVLVVEDDPDSRQLLCIRLEDLGCIVLAADGAEQAFELARDGQPHFAIIDIALNGDKHAGLRLIERLRDEPETAGIPLVIHSVYVRQTSELPEALPDVTTLLPKLFKVEQLANIVRRTRADDGDTETEVILI